MTRACYDVFRTAWGWVSVIGGPAGLRHTSLPERTAEAAMGHIAVAMVDEAPVRQPGAFASYHQQLEEYFAGERVGLDVEHDLSGGSGFFTRAWQACRGIPRGETRTYQWLAAAAGSSGASRAAGQAMARNRLPLIVPCHRVLGTDGGLHGFAGGRGVALKERLLRLEGAVA